jgi:hypothetical protein
MYYDQIFQPQILDRGFDYYQSGYVQLISQTKEEVKAVVSGHNCYEVEIEFKGKAISSLYCDCPYFSGGSNCKHLAAVLYEVENNTNEKDLSLLKDISDQELIQFLKDNLTCNPALKEAFMDKFDRSYEYFSSHLFDDINSFHYVDYENIDKFERKIEKVYKNVSHLIDSNDIQSAFNLLIQLLETVDSVELYCDGDSIFDTMNESTHWFDKILELAPANQKKDIFNVFRKYVNESEQSYVYILEDIYIEDFLEDQFVQIKLSDIQKELEDPETEDRSYALLRGDRIYESLGYSIEKRLELLSDSDDDIVKKHIIHLMFKFEMYESLLPVINSLMSIFEKNSLLERYYRVTNNNEKLKLIYKENIRNLDEFNRYKVLFTEDEWLTTRDDVIQGISNAYLLAEIYSQEKLISELLHVVLTFNSLSFLIKYMDLLIVDYKDIILDYYKKLMLDNAASAHSRNQYRKVLSYLKPLSTYEGDNQIVTELCTYFRQTYKKKTAFMDELNKVIKVM